MATASGISIEEYLRTSYEPDCDYVDGELEDRNVGEYDHGYIQGEMYARFRALRKTLNAYPAIEQRIRVSKTRCRVPDVCVMLGKPDEQVFNKPPFLCIEILSPEDRLARMQRKIRDYLDFGVKFVWLIDPQSRRAWIYIATEIREVSDGVLRTSNPEITVPLSEVLPQ